MPEKTNHNHNQNQKPEAEKPPIMTPEQARRACDLLIRLWWSQQEE